MDKMDMMNAILEEEAKKKGPALHVQIVGWAEQGSHKKMPRISKQRSGHHIPFAPA